MEWWADSMSILTAAPVIGLGLLLIVYHPPVWEKYGGWLFGVLFIAVIFIGLGLLWKFGGRGG